jgi:hypothetical protein
MAPNDEVTVQNLVTFQLGDFPDGGIALLLAYATSQERLSRGEMDSFVIGMTREKAGELGTALLEKAGAAPRAATLRRTEH